MEYDDFLKTKIVADKSSGFEVDPGDVNSRLFPFQREVVRWALRRGRAAIWAECGLGKTPMQLEWADKVFHHTGGDLLILAPLAVAQQTVREGIKFGIEVNHAKSQNDIRPGINISNYERLHKFDCARFVGVVLDESSILKSFMGKIKQAIIEAFRNTPYKLACTATPAPNDHMEIGNHADFLDVMPANEMLARWFINDTTQFGTYRLKGYAIDPFWKWVSSWAVCFQKPSDLGYEDGDFILPELNIHHVILDVDHGQASDGMLFRLPAVNATELHKELRLSCNDRAAWAAAMVNESNESWIVWCNTNYESEALKKLIPDAVEVRGDQPDDQKEHGLISFSLGQARVIITKPSIAGFGLNWQHCHNVIFAGLSYSYEQLYQAIRRSHRFGQIEQVNVYLVASETEQIVLDALLKKQADHRRMQANMYKFNFSNVDTGDNLKLTKNVEVKEARGVDWRVINADSVDQIKIVERDSIGFVILSPPFSNLYIYSDSLRDMGNCRDDQEFLSQFSYLAPELLRVTIPHRLCAIHCKDLVNYKTRDGMAGLRDFPGELIRVMESFGWQYHARKTLWKCPVTEMTRTKAQGLLYKQIRKDSAYCRFGLPEYLLVFRKPGEDAAPIPHTPEQFPLNDWQLIAEPTIPARRVVDSGVWYDIQQTKCLNVQQARESQDEKHICPFQLDLLEQAVRLWTNPGDTILDPFSGIGSTGYVAVKMGRGYIGIELKESYWEASIRHLGRAEREGSNLPLLADMEK
jgi:DNA modification methylase